MEEEREVKVRILDNLSLEDLKQVIEESFGVSLNNFTTEKDTYFDLDNRFYFNNNHGLRVRRGSNGDFFTYKALFSVPHRIDNPWYVLESEEKLPIRYNRLQEILELANIKKDNIPSKTFFSHDELVSILSDKGFTEDIIISKNRYFGSTSDFTFYADDVLDLGIFLEIEAKKTQLPISALTNLNLQYEEIRFGYPNLYAKEVLKKELPNMHLKFSENSSWNYLPNQKEIVDNLIHNQI